MYTTVYYLINLSQPHCQYMSTEYIDRQRGISEDYNDLHGVKVQSRLANKVNQKVTLMIPEEPKIEVENDYLKLSKNKLKTLIKKANQALRAKYPNRRIAKYGNNSKAMTPEHLHRFFGAFLPSDYFYRVVFATQLYLGLRISENCSLKVSDLDFENDQVKIKSAKKRQTQVDFLYMPRPLKELLQEYLHFYEGECTKNDGYLFFSQSVCCKTKSLSPHYARTVFRTICDRAGLTQTYGERESIKSKKFAGGKLHIYSTHSLRHSHGMLLQRNGVPIEVAKIALRHADISTTQIYFKAGLEQQKASSQKVFEHIS